MKFASLILICSLAIASAQDWGMAIMSQSPASSGASPTVLNTWKSLTSAVTVSPSAGSLLVVYCGSTGGVGITRTISDNISSVGWAKACETNTSSPGGAFFYLKNCGSGITTITVSGGTFSCVICYEVSGCSASAPFTTGEQTANIYDVTTNAPSTDPLTYATANSIVFAGITSNGNNPFTINNTGTTGTWTITANGHNDNNSVELVSVPYIIESGTGSAVHVWSVTGDSPYPVLSAAFHP